MTRALAFTFAVAFALAATRAHTVHAQASPDLSALGKQEFERGRTEFNLGNYEAALKHFEASYRLTGRPALLYNIGVTERRLFERTRQLARLEQAVERLRAFLTSAAEVPPEQRSRAKADLDEVEALLQRETAARAEGEATLKLGEELAAQGRLDEAEAQLQRYRASEEPPRERAGTARAHRLRGLILGRRGHLKQATDAFARALSLDRGLRVPENAPPAVHRAFDAARERLEGQPVLAVEHAPPGSLKRNQAAPLPLQVKSDPEKLIAQVRLSYRAGAGAFSQLRGKPGDMALPASFVSGLPEGGKVEYYLDVLDEDGAVLVHLGTAQLPFTVPLAAPPGKGVAKKWWFWTATVGGLAAAGLAVGLGVHFSQPPVTEAPIRVSLLSW